MEIPKGLTPVIVGGVAVVGLLVGGYFAFFSGGEGTNDNDGFNPVAIIEYSPDAEITSDSDITFDASRSDFLGEPVRIIRHSWDFGDDTKVEAERITHRFTEPGSYTVQLIIEYVDENNQFGTAMAAQNITVGLPELPDVSASAGNEFCLQFQGGGCSGGGSTIDVFSDQPVMLDAQLELNNQSIPCESLSTDSLEVRCLFEWTVYDSNGIEVRRISTDNPRTQFGILSPPQDYQLALNVTMLDQHDRAEEIISTQRSLVIHNYQPEVQLALSREPEDGDAYQVNEEIYFDASGTFDREGSDLFFRWDFDGDESIDAEEAQYDNNPRPEWTFEEPGTYLVKIQARDQYMLDRQEAPVTEVIRVVVGGIATNRPNVNTGVGSLPGSGVDVPFVATGGIGMIGGLRLWDINFGLPINVGPGIIPLFGFGMNMEPTIINRSPLYPNVLRIYPNATITTVIDSALWLTTSVYYPIQENLYIGAGAGYLQLKGSHISSHPRILINRIRISPFEQTNFAVTLGVAYKLNFALLWLRVVYPM